MAAPNLSIDAPAVADLLAGDVALVVNGRARRGAEALSLAQDRLAGAGVGSLRTRVVDDGADLEDTLDDVLADAPDLLLVAGGDGSVTCAAGRVAGTRTVLGVLPLGTANDFARTLEVPLDPAAAVAGLPESLVADVDLGRAGRRPFLNVASMGLSVGVADRLTPALKRRLGRLAYPVATARAYRHHVSFAVRLEFPDGDHPTVEVDDVLQLAVGNGRHHGGGLAVSPDASVDDHLLDVYCIERGRLREHVSIARLFRDRGFVDHERVHHTTTRAVRVVAAPNTEVNLDGEVVGLTPLTFTVQRNALRVLVPRDSTAARWEGVSSSDC